MASQVALEDSNVAGLGSDLDKNLRLHAAATEKAYEGAGTHPGVQVWRIEKLEVKSWPKAQYGTFYSGDSYIVLKTNQKPDSNALTWELHFWLGANTSRDEAGVAAYKTVELDDLLRGAPIQHREVQGYESDLFLSYFPPGIKLLDGGVESGFNHVEPEKYKPRLLQVKKAGKNVRVAQVAAERASLNDGDVFILDAGETVYQFNGASANAFEKLKASEVVASIKNDRGKIEEKSGDDDGFWAILGGRGAVAPATPDVAAPAFEKALFRLSDASGKLEFKQEGKGKVNKGALDSSDVFILDTGSEVFVWVGKGASANEKRTAMTKAQEYFDKQNRPSYLPVTRVLDGAETAHFLKAFE